MLHHLICVAATSRPGPVFFLELNQDVRGDIRSVKFFVFVAMFATTKNPTMKTLINMTIAMKTTMATVQHGVLGSV